MNERDAMTTSNLQNASMVPNRIDGLVPVPYVGISFLQSWIFMLFYARSAGIEAAAPISLMGNSYMFSAVVMVLTVVGIAFWPSNLNDRLMSPTAKMVAPLLLSISTAALIVCEVLGLFWLLYISSAATGLFSGVMSQQWIIAYKRVSLRTLICSFPVLITVAVGTCVTVMYLPHAFMMGVTVILPCVSGLMLHSVRKYLFPLTDIDTGPKDKPLNFAMVLLPVGIFGFATGFLDFFSFESTYTFVFYAAVSFIPFAISGAFVLLHNRASAMQCLVIPLLVLVVIFVPLFILADALPASNFIAIGELGNEIVLFVIAVGFATFFDLSSLKTYALVRATMVLLNSGGWYTAWFSNENLDNLMNAQASFAFIFIGIEVLAVCLVAATVNARKRIGAESKDSDSPSEEGDAPTTSKEESKSSTSLPGRELSDMWLTARCVELGDAYGLSLRERDVLKLLAQGYSSARIQAELYIASGTVNYHTRNIYTKLGVHSKQEVIDLVLNEADQD